MFVDSCHFAGVCLSVCVCLPYFDLLVWDYILLVFSWMWLTSLGCRVFCFVLFCFFPFLHEIENCVFHVCEELSWNADRDCIESVDGVW